MFLLLENDGILERKADTQTHINSNLILKFDFGITADVS